jgi:gas vesicle protein
MMRRILFGAIIGGAAVYLLDPEHGPRRRARLRAGWEQNREPILNTASKTAATAQESVSQFTDQAGSKMTELKAKAQQRGSDQPKPTGNL